MLTAGNGKPDAMLEALKRKRGKGLDLTIILGDEAQEEQKDSDLAPKGEEISSEGEMEAVEQVAGEQAPEQTEEEKLEAEMLEELAQGESLDPEEVQGRKPKSLSERARMAMAMKKK